MIDAHKIKSTAENYRGGSQDLERLAAVRVALVMWAVVALLALGARQKASADCQVSATYPDGRVEERECIVDSREHTRPSARGRFESCTA